jgi:hypothetical protein
MHDKLAQYINRLRSDFVAAEQECQTKHNLDAQDMRAVVLAALTEYATQVIERHHSDLRERMMAYLFDTLRAKHSELLLERIL